MCVLISDERPKEPSEADAPLSDDVLNKPCQEEKLLLILSNSSYTKSHVGPRLIDCFVGNGYPENKNEESVSDVNIMSWAVAKFHFIFHSL